MRFRHFCFVISILLPASLQAEPFFPRTVSQRVTYRTVMIAPENVYRVSRPVPDDYQDNEPEPRAQSSGAKPTVSGNRAALRGGIAYAPENAPDNVKRLIWAVNTLRDKPYKWGGGHGSFNDCGYDCSGTVSFALHNAGVLDAPIPSREFLDYGRSGAGRWITIYSRSGHTFAVVAGLRLDTTGFYEKDGPRWRATGRSTGGFSARHPEGL